jgi:pilus assembly protein CpaC
MHNQHTPYPIHRAIRCAVLVCAFPTLGLCLDSGSGGAYDKAARELRLVVGSSAALDYAAEIARIATSNPDVADAVSISKHEVLVNAKAVGASTVVIWSRSGGRTFYSVVVDANVEPMRRIVAEAFPNEAMDVVATRDSIAIIGKAGTQAAVDRAVALLAPLAKAVVANVAVPAPGPEKQIILRVKFAEINRSVESAFGVNLLSTGVLNTPGRISTTQFPSGAVTELNGSIPGRNEGTTSKFSMSDLLNVFAFRPDLNLGAVIKALQTQGLLQVLAEPNLVTTNGKEASFLVGGEFPVPIVQGGANAGAVTIQFREFGIRLNFLPVSTAHGTIKLHVKPEVSTIDPSSGVSFSGFTIPALSTRRMETDIELGEGQTFAIAGLIDDRVTETLSKIPGLANLPVFGSLFKSRSAKKSKSELVVIVTPELARPVQAGESASIPAMPVKFLAPLAPQPTGGDAAGSKGKAQ